MAEFKERISVEPDKLLARVVHAVGRLKMNEEDFAKRGWESDPTYGELRFARMVMEAVLGENSNPEVPLPSGPFIQFHFEQGGEQSNG